MRFSVKLVLLFGIIILIISIPLSYYTYSESKNALEKEIISKLEVKALSKMSSIDMMLSERYADIQIMASGAIMKSRNSTPEQITQRLLVYRNIYKSYASLSFFDMNRVRIADTSGLSIGEQNELEKYFEESSGGKISAASDIKISSTLNTPIIYFASPVRDEKGETFGVVVSRVPISKVYDVLVAGEEDIEIGSDEDIDLIDSNGVFLYSTHNRAGILKDKINFLDKIKEQSKDSNLGSFYYNVEGEDSIVAFAKEQGYLDFKGNDWTLILHIPVKAAFAPVYSMIYKLGIILAGVFIVFCFVIFYFSRKLSNPIHELHKATEEIEKGNFKSRTDIKSGDELEQLGNSFNRMAEQLEITDEERKQLDKSKTEFLSITSHELRSPMTPMKAQLQMLLGDYFGRLNKKQKESVDIVLRNTDRLDRIIQDFLEISRIEAARLKFNFIRASLSEYIKRVIEEMKGFMPEKKIKIEARLSQLPAIEVDPDRVMQVLRNLLNNAIKFSKENGKIIVTAELRKNMIQFSVKDDGMGIAPENRARIFEPFFQAGGMYQREFGGTGLGLAICKGIIESQSGRIWFESEFGKGAAFYFTVPLKPVREITPIKILFSSKQDIERKLELIFEDILGPLGSIEFEVLRKGSGLIKENLIEYIDSLAEKKIITKESAEKFSNEVTNILGGKSKEEIAEDIFVEILGPLGKKQFGKIGTVTEENILEQIRLLKQKGILNNRESEEFKNRVRRLYWEEVKK